MISRMLVLIKQKRAFFRNLFILTLSKYFKQGAIFLKGLILARLLTVEDFGVYSLFLMFLTFSVFISLGSTYSLNKQLSINNINTNQRDIIIGRSNLILISSNVVFLFLFIFIVLNVETVFGNAIFLLGAILVLQQYNIFYENILRALQEFQKISVGLFLVAIIDLLLIFSFLKNININLILIFYFIAVLITNIYYRYITRKILKTNFLFPDIKFFTENKRGLYNHVVLGLSLLLYNLNYLLFINTDKLIISTFYGIESLGIYTFATNLVAGTMVLLQGFNYIMYPKLLKKFSTIHSKKKAIKLYKKMILILVPFLFVFNSLVFIISTIFIEKMYIDYIAAINIILILFIGQIFNIVTIYSNTISIAQNQESKLLRLQIISLLTNIILGLICVFLGLDLFFIGLSTVISQIILCSFSIKNTISVIKQSADNKRMSC